MFRLVIHFEFIFCNVYPLVSAPLVEKLSCPSLNFWITSKNQFTIYCGSIPCIVDYLFCLIVLYVSPYTFSILFDYYNITVNLEIVCFVLKFYFPLNTCIFNWLQYFRVIVDFILQTAVHSSSGFSTNFPTFRLSILFSLSGF